MFNVLFNVMFLLLLLFQAGILEGVLVLVFVAVVSVKAMLLVIDCKYTLTEKRLPESIKPRKPKKSAKGNRGV